MKKAASAFLRMEICHADITRMIRWMRNPNVTKYLNEAPDVAQSLEQLVRSVPEPMYQYHLCRTGHFFMVCHQENESVGFVKLLPTATEGAYLHLRADRVVAKVMPQNLRSIRCVRACGFQQMAEMPRLVRFEITFDAYCRSLQEKRA
jgi:regulator of nucleoside diphosphate kinase